MKKSMLILILTALLTSCGIEENPPETAEIPTAQTVTEASDSDVESCTEAETQPSAECEISAAETAVTSLKIKSEAVCTTTAVINQQEEKSQYDPTEAQKEKTVEIPKDYTESVSEESSEESPKYNTESSRSSPLENSRSNENPNCPPGSPGENTPFTEAATEEMQPPECCLSDYEKALEVYNYMTVNGSGTCVQYAWQTYEMCCEYDLECRFVWTENQLYGHVANVVRVDGVWYVLDTQAGCFLTENIFEFTEIVDADESFISDVSIISEVRYDQLDH